ncbi:Glutathione S-transferase, C-terminal [Dillenia turbinata]|uniref:Glutathione S-transferase, C-terminal n=1 Tax=Dillenia turbinata TaxID=194707 RepID=A0AAN8VDB6_9MAGN
MRSLALTEKEIEWKKYFGGDQIGYLDVAMSWIPRWIDCMEQVGNMKLLDAKKFPSLHQWSQNFVEVPTIKEVLPPKSRILSRYEAT